MHPWPRVDAGDLAVNAGIRCGMDISDGLVQDLGHVCRASGVDAELRFDDIPVDEALQLVYPDDARMLAASGGEDYELVLAGGRLEKLLIERGAKLTYSDPYVPALREEGLALESLPARDVVSNGCDCVVVLTDHSDFDYSHVASAARCIVDARNAMRGIPGDHIVRL